MKKVFLFCIGGTGLRVMKSVTMLLAAGMDAKGFSIVPVLIDPHIDLEEKRNLQNLINEYESLHKSIYEGIKQPPANSFFYTDITDISKLKGQQNDYSDPIAEKKPFGQYLNIGKLNSGDINNYLVQTLFSQENLDNSLSVGFKGSPNVGTVVLGEKIKGANWYKTFCNAFQQEDRVFIISSIFGGTGASGYPILEKKIRQTNDFPIVKNTVMGAVTVLPYYSLEDPATTGSDIDSSNFLTKARSALAYYENNIESDYIYYVGEQKVKKIYPNDESKQEDTAHFIELVAATALFDFLGKPEERPEKTQALSRSIKEDYEKLTFSKLGDSYSDVVKVVADMTILSRLVYILPDEKQFPLSKNRGFESGFYNDKDFTNLRAFLIRFAKWYEELKDNSRGFDPINIADPYNRKADLSNWISDFSLNAKDESYYLLEMIKASNKDSDNTYTNKFFRWMNYAYKAINKYTDKIK